MTTDSKRNGKVKYIVQNQCEFEIIRFEEQKSTKKKKTAEFNLKAGIWRCALITQLTNGLFKSTNGNGKCFDL